MWSHALLAFPAPAGARPHRRSHAVHPEDDAAPRALGPPAGEEEPGQEANATNDGAAELTRSTELDRLIRYDPFHRSTCRLGYRARWRI